MKSIGVVLAGVFLTASVFADLTVVQTVKSDLMPGQTQTPSTMTMSIKGQKARIDLPGTQMSSIIDLKTGKVYTLDHKQKQVMEMSLDDIKKAAELASQSQDQQAAKPTVAKTGKKEVIKGYKCAEYEIKGTGADASTINCWITEDVDDAEMDAFRSVGGRMGGFLGLEGVEKPKGMLIRSESKMNISGRTVTSSTEVQEIRKAPVADSLFALPADYKVLEMPNFAPPPPAK